MKNKKTLKHLPLIIAVFMLIATISAGSNVFAEQMSIFENYENRGTDFITNVRGRILGTNKEIKNPFDTYILETQTYIITAHPNGVAEIISKTLNPERDIIMVELPENMSIDEYINNNRVGGR
jgi:hypothetical protein